MSYNLEIDLEKCTKCGLCEKSCGLKVVEMVNEKPKERPYLCNSCGHCAAICPVDAIVLKDSDMSNFTPIQNHGISYEQFYNIVRNRKSIRNYKQQQVSDDHLNKLMESVRYIPTGANRQALKYLIITDPDQLMEIRKKVAKNLKKLKFLAKLFKPLVPKFEYTGCMRMNEQWKKYKKAGYQGFDTYLQNAPCVVIIYTRKRHMLTQWESGIASYNLILAAETLGLKTELLGYVALASKVFRMNKVCKIPKKHKILAAMLVGYPDIKYLKTVDRRPLDVKRY